MSITALTVINLKENNYAVQAGDLLVTFTAADASNGNKFPFTGSEVLLVQNSDTGPHTFTVSSVADSLGRTGDIATYSVAAGAFAAIQLKDINGWIQTDGTVHLAVSDATIKFAVLRLN